MVLVLRNQARLMRLGLVRCAKPMKWTLQKPGGRTAYRQLRETEATIMAIYPAVYDGSKSRWERIRPLPRLCTIWHLVYHSPTPQSHHCKYAKKSQNKQFKPFTSSVMSIYGMSTVHSPFFYRFYGTFVLRVMLRVRRRVGSDIRVSKEEMLFVLYLLRLRNNANLSGTQDTALKCIAKLLNVEDSSCFLARDSSLEKCLMLVRIKGLAFRVVLLDTVAF